MTDVPEHPSLARSVVVGGLGGFGLSLMGVWIPGLGPALCCGALVSTGLLAVWHRVAVTQTSMPTREAVRMGAQAGTVAFVASAAISALAWTVSGRPNIASRLRNSGAEFGSEMPPELVEQAARTLDRPDVVLGIVLGTALLYTLLGLVGGALGAGVFQRANLPDPPAE